MSTNLGQRRHDPLTGFGDHDTLIADLTRALEPGSPPAVLAVFELVGSSYYRQALGEQAARELIAGCAERFAGVIASAGACYRPRQDEFCALLEGPIEELSATLVAAEEAIAAAEGLRRLSGCFGAATLPDEADDPIELLMLADERLGVRLGGRRSRRPLAGSPRR